VPLSDYQATMAQAIAYCRGDRLERPAELERMMRAAAGSLAFEKAASIRTSIERAAAAQKREEYVHVSGLEQCNWLIVQRAGPARRSPRGTLVKPFFVRGGRLAVGPAVSLADVDEGAVTWIAACREESAIHDQSSDDISRSELLWLVAKYLFQGERAPGLFVRFDQLPDAGGLAEAVRRRFSSEENRSLVEDVIPSERPS
jgi:hypothetical protein